MDLGLKGKVAVVTGGSVGIGSRSRKALATTSTSCLRRAAPNACATKLDASPGEFGVRAEGVACDVASREGTDAFVAPVKQAYGGADGRGVRVGEFNSL